MATGGGITATPILLSNSIKVERSLVVGDQSEGFGDGVFVDGNNGGSFRMSNSPVIRNSSASAGEGVALNRFESGEQARLGGHL